MYINLNRISMKKEWIEPELVNMDVTGGGKVSIPETIGGTVS